MDPDVKVGRDAMIFFHNASARYSTYKLTFDELMATYGKKADIYAEGIGMAIRFNNISPSSVRKAMEGLANTAQGRIPKDHQDYINALQGEAKKINWLDLTSAIAKETLTQSAQGLATFGNQVTSTLSTLTFLLPFLVVGAVLFVFSSRVKQVAGKK